MTTSTDPHQTLVSNLKLHLEQQQGEAVQEIQTHISSVLLAGDFAYKIKKPLDLGFLDFSTLERRHHCCHEELRLNSRLAPQIYLDVVSIHGSAEAPELGGEGEPIDYAVRMRRFAQADLLTNRIESLDTAHARSLAVTIARFHADIARAPDSSDYGTPETVVFPMRQNFDQIRERVDDSHALERLIQVERWTEQRYAELGELLAGRKRDGFIRECHGDLHLGNMAEVDGELVIFDGIEFNPDLSWIDTFNELAFLLMDLEERGREDLSRLVLNDYLEESGDYAGLPLLRFYMVYRALVRAKIAVIRLSQTSLPDSERAAVYTEFNGYLSRAEAYMEAQKRGLLMTFGVSGSGKSTLTQQLIQEWPAIRLRSDVERKRLVGMHQSERSQSSLGAGLYTSEISNRTYAHLLDLVGSINQAGFLAIVDATFLQLERRRPFTELAEQLGIPLVILDFQVTPAELRRRVTQRLEQGGDPSEADVAVLESQLAACEPLGEAEQAHALVISEAGTLSRELLASRLS